MTKEQAKAIIKTKEIVDENVEEVLKKYLAPELVRKIKSEIIACVEWDLRNEEEWT